MIEHSFIHRANAEFEQALHKAWVRSIRRLVTQTPHHLSSFQPVQAHIHGQYDRGLQTVLLSEIIGSAGRASDFDCDFRPRHSWVRDRWVQIEMAYLRGQYLPPVELYKVGSSYYVKDGHHRISVMRHHGQVFVDAYVVELQETCLN